MEVTRTFLRSETGDKPKQVRMAGSITQTKGKYGEELRGQLSTIGEIRRKSPVIQAKRVDAVVTEPEQYTKDAIKTALEKLGLAVQEGLAGDQGSTPSTQIPSSGGGGGGGNKGFFSGSDLSGMSTQQLVDRDNKMYGNTFPAGSFSPTDTGAMVNRDKMMYGNTFPEGSFNITKPKEEKAPMGTTFTGIGTKEFTKAFTEKQKEQPKQTVAALPSDYKETEKAAFDKAKSWQDSKAKGEAATKATGIPSKPPAGSFGISAEGKKTAEANRAEAKKKAQAQKKKSSPSTTKSSSSPSASKKGSTGSKKSSRGAKGSSSSGSKGGTSKGGAKGKSSGSRGQGSASKGAGKGGSFGGKRRSSNTKKSRRRCDIRCKFDISVLTNQNLIRDDLADVAYFVKDLQEIN